MHEGGRMGEWMESASAWLAAHRRALLLWPALLIALSFLVRDDEASFACERLPGFWALFALLGAVAMVFVLKRMILPLLTREEDKEQEGDDGRR